MKSNEFTAKPRKINSKIQIKVIFISGYFKYKYFFVYFNLHFIFKNKETVHQTALT